MNKRTKTAKQMERHLKGLGNHYRIEILLLLDKSRGLTVDDITERLDANYKTVAQHVSNLVRAGLIEKSQEHSSVHNRLSPYGEACVEFLKKFQTF